MPRRLAPHVMASTAGEHDAVRDHILDAAHRVIARDGLGAASTRAIADEAGVAIGTLYNYFDDRLQLLVHSMLKRAHLGSRSFAEFSTRAGSDCVAGNLRLFASQLETMLDELVPLFSAAFSDIDLLKSLRDEMASVARSSGPFAGHPVEQYLLAEQRRGRVLPDADCRAAASLVLSLCHDRAFRRFFHGEVARAKPATAEIDLIARALTGPQPSAGSRRSAPRRRAPARSPRE